MITVNSHAELDALVAEKVMGWKPTGRVSGVMETSEGFMFEGVRLKFTLPFEYSTDIAAAWQVVEKMFDTGLETELKIRPSRSLGNRFACFLWKPDGTVASSPRFSNTAPLAICLCALTSVGVDIVFQPDEERKEK